MGTFSTIPSPRVDLHNERRLHLSKGVEIYSAPHKKPDVQIEAVFEPYRPQADEKSAGFSSKIVFRRIQLFEVVDRIYENNSSGHSSWSRNRFHGWRRAMEIGCCRRAHMQLI